MKLKSMVAAGIIGTAGVLTLATSQSHAGSYPTCKSGSIVTAGAGYVTPGGSLGNGLYAANRYVTLTCDAGQTANDLSGWDGTARTFVLSTSSLYDQDGKYATVLTLLAMGGTKKVSFSASNFKTGTANPDNPGDIDNAILNGRIITALGIIN
jgi:hypothetical protein